MERMASLNKDDKIFLLETAVEDMDFNSIGTAKTIAKKYGEMLALSEPDNVYDKINDSYDEIYGLICIINNVRFAMSRDDWMFIVRDAWSWKKSELEDERKKSMGKKKMKIVLATEEAIKAFWSAMDKESDDYSLVSMDESTMLPAKSQLARMYAISEIGNTFFLVNNTHDGMFPDTLGTDGYHQF